MSARYEDKDVMGHLHVLQAQLPLALLASLHTQLLALLAIGALLGGLTSSAPIPIPGHDRAPLVLVRPLITVTLAPGARPRSPVLVLIFSLSTAAVIAAIGARADVAILTRLAHAAATALNAAPVPATAPVSPSVQIPFPVPVALPISISIFASPTGSVDFAFAHG